MALVAGALVPHAPVLALKDGSSRLRTSIEVLRTSMRSLSFEDCDVLVVVSPHGRATGVYAEVVGSLDEFGARGYSVTLPTELVVAKELARAWMRPMLESPVDHGITGALLPAEWPSRTPSVAATFATTTGPGAPAEYEQVVAEATALADTLDRFASRIGFVASAHTSAALSPAAPLLDRPQAHELEDRVLAALRRDVADLAGIEPQLWRAAGACGAGPLTAFGRLFAGRRADLLAYEAPTGVGYLVAQVVGT